MIHFHKYKKVEQKIYNSKEGYMPNTYYYTVYAIYKCEKCDKLKYKEIVNKLTYSFLESMKYKEYLKELGVISYTEYIIKN